MIQHLRHDPYEDHHHDDEFTYPASQSLMTNDEFENDQGLLTVQIDHPSHNVQQPKLHNYGQFSLPSNSLPDLEDFTETQNLHHLQQQQHQIINKSFFHDRSEHDGIFNSDNRHNDEMTTAVVTNLSQRHQIPHPPSPTSTIEPTHDEISQAYFDQVQNLVQDIYTNLPFQSIPDAQNEEWCANVENIKTINILTNLSKIEHLLKQWKKECVD